MALGALVAVGTAWLKKIPTRCAAPHLGRPGRHPIASFAFNAQTAYPGSLVAVPVVGAALIIAGGHAPRLGAEFGPRAAALQWMGKRSYSFYLWHWPILIIAAERVGKTRPPLDESLILVLIAVALSAVTYVVVENPVRHLRYPAKKSVVAGITIIAATLVLLSLAIGLNSGPAPSDLTTPLLPAPNAQVIAAQVAAAPRITSVPKNVQPALSSAAADYGGFAEPQSCIAHELDTRTKICTLGDRYGRGLIVLYGDSHAVMWLQAFDAIAKTSHMRLVILAKEDCPAGFVTVSDPPGLRQADGPYTECDQWHDWVATWINAHRPQVLVVSQRSLYTAPAVSDGNPAYVTPARWQQGLAALFSAIAVPRIQNIVLGNIPGLGQSAPTCLSAHSHDVQACSQTLAKAQAATYNAAQRNASLASGARYIDVTGWFCSSICTAIIDHYVVYMDPFHVTSTYAQHLETVLGQALHLQ